MIGVCKNDEKTVKVSFPDNYGNKELSGREAEFKCKIKEVSGPILPKFDDELAKKFGLESLKKLKENLKAQVQSEFEQASKTLLKKKLMDKLEKELKFELPESLVLTEANAIAMHKAQNESKTEETKKEPKATKEDKKLAERRVRVGLFFAEFGIDNKLDLSESELEAAFEAEARRYPGQEQAYLKFIRSNPQAQQAIRAPLFEEKVVNRLLETISLKEKKVSVDKLKEQIEILEQT